MGRNLTLIHSRLHRFSFKYQSWQNYIKKAELLQESLNKKIKRLEFDYQPNNVKEKEETSSVLMHAKELLEYRDKIIKAFEKGIFFV